VIFALPPELRLMRSALDRRQWPSLAVGLFLVLVTIGLSTRIGSPGMEDYEAWQEAHRASLASGAALAVGLLIGLFAADLRAEVRASPALALLSGMRERLAAWILWPTATAGALGAAIALVAGAPGGPILGFAQGALAAALPWFLSRGLFHWLSFLILVAGGFGIFQMHKLERPTGALTFVFSGLGLALGLTQRSELRPKPAQPRISLLGLSDALEQSRDRPMVLPGLREEFAVPRLSCAEDYLGAIDHEMRCARGRTKLPHPGFVAPMVYVGLLIEPFGQLFRRYFPEEPTLALEGLGLRLWTAVFGTAQALPEALTPANNMTLVFICLLVGLPSLSALLVLRQRFPYVLSRNDRAAVADAFSKRLRQQLVFGQLADR